MLGDLLVLWLGVKSVILLKKNDGIDVGEFVSTLVSEVDELSGNINLNRCR